MECGYSGGSMAGAIIGTFFVTIILGAILLIFWKKRREKQNPLRDLVLVEDGGASKNFSGYDNVGFVDESSDPKKLHHHQGRRSNQKFSNGKGMQKSNNTANQDVSKNKKMPWGPFSFIFGKNSKGTLDDSALEDPIKYNVGLKGHDFTGLGFTVCGNLKEGIFVKDVMQRGPAAESKQIMPGDKIIGMRVCFDHMVLEDALTLLSYASPYEVNLEMTRLPEKHLVSKGMNFSSSSSTQSGTSNSSDRVCHPFFKSQSIDDLRKMGRERLENKSEVKMRNGEDNKANSSINKDKRMSKSINSTPTVSHTNVEKNNDTRTGSMIVMAGHNEKTKNREAFSMSIDELDTPYRVSIEEIKVIKPDVVPRAKSKAAHLKSSSQIVEAISPAIQMEEIEKNNSMGRASPSKVMRIECEEVPNKVIEHMMDINEKNKKEHSEIYIEETRVSYEVEMNRPQIKEIMMESEKIQLKEADKSQEKEIVEKMMESEKYHLKQEASKSKEKEVKEIEKIMEGEKYHLKQESNKSKEKEVKEKEKMMESEKYHLKQESNKSKEREVKEKEKMMESGKTQLKESNKSKEKEAKEKEKMVESSSEKSHIKEANKSKEIEIKEKDKMKNEKSMFSKLGTKVLPDMGIHLTKKSSTPEREIVKESFEKKSSPKNNSTKVNEELEVSMRSQKSEHNDENTQEGNYRPPSAESSSSIKESKDKKSSGFHMPSIKLPMFHRHSKEYNLEIDSKSSQEQGSSIPTSSYEITMPEVKLRRIEDSEIEKVNQNLDTSRDEKITIETVETVQMNNPNESEITSSKEEKKSPDKVGFMTKGIQSLKELKEKVAHKLSVHDSPSSESEDEAVKDKVAKKTKETKEKNDELKLKQKIEKEEKMRAKSIEKEKLKAEKKAKKEELKRKSSASKGSMSRTSDSSSSSSESENETNDATKTKNKIKGSKSKMKEDKKMRTETEDVNKIESYSSAQIVSQNPPVAPNILKDSLMRDDDSKNIESKRIDMKSKIRSSSSSSSSSESDSESKSLKPKKPKRSNKRKAPIPPHNTSIITTEIEKHHFPPEIIETTVKKSTDSIERSKSPEGGKRSASYGDLSSNSLKSKIELMDRAVSMDLRETNENNYIIPMMPHIEDLSNTDNSSMLVQQFRTRDSLDSLSTSNETLKSSTASIVHVHPKEPHSLPDQSQIQKIMLQTELLMEQKLHFEEDKNNYAETLVTISTSGTSVLDNDEVHRVAKEAVDDVMDEVSKMDLSLMTSERRVREKTPEKKPSKIPVSIFKSNVTVTNIQDEDHKISPHFQLAEDDMSSTKKKSKLLRDDSKSRLMQMVADANDIKISSVSPALRKDSATYSSSSSQSSPEIRGDKPKIYTEEFNNINSVSLIPTHNLGGQMIEISSQELDTIMMSHSEFLNKQIPPKDSSFDNWVYVDQKLLQSSSSEPSASSHDDDDDGNYSRNLSPTTFKMETEFETSELRVTTSKDTKVYSTTMTLPQKTVTQIMFSSEENGGGTKIIEERLELASLPKLEPLRK